MTLDLGEAAASTVRVTAEVPNVNHGRDVTDELAAFVTDERSADDGLLEVELSPKPIFIEEIFP